MKHEFIEIQECHECGEIWNALMEFEKSTNYLGFVKETDALCPSCKHEPKAAHQCATCEEK